MSAAAYLPRGRRQGRYWTIGDTSGVKGRSLFVRLAPPGIPGKWTDAATNEHGDLLDLIRLHTGGASLRHAMEEALAFLALPPCHLKARMGAASLIVSTTIGHQLSNASFELSGRRLRKQCVPESEWRTDVCVQHEQQLLRPQSPRLIPRSLFHVFYMDASRFARDDLVCLAGRLQFYIRPVCAGFCPAGPDGICRSTPHSHNGLVAQDDMQAWNTFPTAARLPSVTIGSTR